MTTAQERLQRKQLAYDRAFCAEVQLRLTRWQLVRWMARALFTPQGFYQLTFKGADGKPNPAAAEVLADLKRVAGINKGGIVISPISRIVDSHASVYRAGQRDMYLRIVKFLGFDESDNVEDGQ